MNVLVTGSGGFIGRHVVAAFLERGHSVRAVVRPSSDPTRPGFEGRVETFRADFRATRDLEPAFDGVDALVHLAAEVAGDDETRFASTVVGTERLLAAMGRTATRRLVLASSFTVYAYAAFRRRLDEGCRLECGRALYERDGYAIAKVWQERVARRAGEMHGWDLRVVRPGLVWGRGNEWVAGLGYRTGRLCSVFAPRRRLCLTHVENCAHAFVTVTEHPAAEGQTFNLVDGHGVRAWRYVRDYLRGTGTTGWRLGVPYGVGLAIAYVAKGASRLLFGRGARLPGLLVPRRFRARFKPVDASAEKLRALLGWSPPLAYEVCLRRTYAGLPP